ncbi:MAG: type 4a pilus biogenesis protein PilO [Actinobacteria bacterium]|nr:type 4a pilus biogenesis protein PilO [Actinomycetota bacterium]
MRVRIGAGLWLLAVAIVCLIVLVLGLFLIVFPQKNKVGEVEDRIAEVETSIQTEQNRLAQLKQLEKDPEQFTRQIDVLKQRIPENVELADVIEQIDHAAEEAGLDFYSFTPSIPVAAQNFYVMTCESVFNGRYFNLVEFFNHIERLPRSVKVVKLEIQEADAGLPYIQAHITFRVFFTTTEGIEGLVTSPGGGAGGAP